MRRHAWARFTTRGAVVAGLLALAMPAGTALAHANVASTSLADGAVVEEAPATISLSFDEEVLVPSSAVTLVHVADGSADTLAVTAADGGATVVVAMPALADGGYVLRFGVVDPADLHRTVGSISFGVGVAAPPSESGRQVVMPWWSTLVRASGDAALLFGVGASALLAMCGAAFVAADRRRVAVWAVWAAVAQVVAWTAVLLVECSTIGWSTVSSPSSVSSVLLGSEPGRRVVIGAQMAAGLWWLLRLPATTVSARVSARVSLALWSAMVLLASVGGHSGVGGSVAIGALLKWVHLVALGVWLGSIAVVAALRNHRGDRATVWQAVGRCSAVGLAGTGVTGLLLSGRMVETVTGLLSSRAGGLGLVKMAGLCVLAVAGGLNARRVVRSGLPRRRLLAVELGLAAVLVVVAASLAGTPPAVGEAYRPLPAAEPHIVTADAADLLVSATVEPARPGSNLVSVSVLDTRRPSPGAVSSVRVVFADAAGHEVASDPVVPVDGRAEVGGLVLPGPGTWTMSIEVDRPAAPVAPVGSVVEISATPVARAHTIVSDHEWWPLAALAAFGWGVVVLVASRRLGRLRRTAALRSDRRDGAEPASAAETVVAVVVDAARSDGGGVGRQAAHRDAAVVDQEQLLELEAGGVGETSIGGEQDEACVGV